jgi:hypothetical protein
VLGAALSMGLAERRAPDGRAILASPLREQESA